MRKILKPSYFRRDALTVARALLGKVLVRRIRGKEHAATIVETEAYHGFEDRASHASRGKTKRNAPMFERGGVWYAYFVYGMHWMLNAVTSTHGLPSAVLIRGLEGMTGPARLTKRLKIGRRQDGKPIAKATGLWIEDRGNRVPAKRIRRAPRIGVDYAGAWAKKPYRFFLRER